MQPPDGKPTRRGMRRALRGVLTGKRATHPAGTKGCACCALSPDAHDNRPCAACGHTQGEGNQA